jgi:hypothetical protein
VLQTGNFDYWLHGAPEIQFGDGRLFDFWLQGAPVVDFDPLIVSVERTATALLESDGLHALTRDGAALIEWVLRVQRTATALLESDGLHARARDGAALLEWESLATVSRTATALVEWLQAVSRTGTTLAENSATLNRDGTAPLEWDGSHVRQHLGTALIEFSGVVQRVARILIESGGLDPSDIGDTFDIQRLADVLFVDLFDVLVPPTYGATFEDRFAVQPVAVADLIDTFGVIPEGLEAEGFGDIQRPTAQVLHG